MSERGAAPVTLGAMAATIAVTVRLHGPAAATIAVTVRLHGPAADGAPQREFVITVPETATTDALWDALVARMPMLRTLRPLCALAIDNAWAREPAPLHEGAVVDLIPPVSGG